MLVPEFQDQRGSTLPAALGSPAGSAPGATRLPEASELQRLIDSLPEPLSTAVWLAAVTCVRPEELAFKWSDLNVEKRQLWIIRVVNRGKLHPPKVTARTARFSSPRRMSSGCWH